MKMYTTVVQIQILNICNLHATLVSIEVDEHVTNNKYVKWNGFGDSNKPNIYLLVYTEVFLEADFMITHYEHEDGNDDFMFTHYELEDGNAFSRSDRKTKAPYERTIAASIIISIACNEMYELIKKTTAIEALCQTFSCANAPSCSPKETD